VFCFVGKRGGLCYENLSNTEQNWFLGNTFQEQRANLRHRNPRTFSQVRNISEKPLEIPGKTLFTQFFRIFAELDKDRKNAWKRNLLIPGRQLESNLQGNARKRTKQLDIERRTMERFQIKYTNS